MQYNIPDEFIVTLNKLRDIVYNYNIRAGWYDKPREFGTRIALLHSELSEALEGDRKGLMDSHLPHRRSSEVEIMDMFIRGFDLAGAENYDFAALAEKFEYNRHRQDHKRENRGSAGGKAY
jgi:hypothetical protein